LTLHLMSEEQIFNLGTHGVSCLRLPTWLLHLRWRHHWRLELMACLRLPTWLLHLRWQHPCLAFGGSIPGLLQPRLELIACLRLLSWLLHLLSWLLQ